MQSFCFSIATLDQTLMARWQAAFKKEGWLASASICPDAPLKDNGQVRLFLVEVGAQPCRTPEDLREVIEKRKPTALIAFASPQNISNSQIIRFLESGADDFVYSNTDERVIVAKLKAYIRRLEPAIEVTLTRLESSNGDVMIDKTKRSVKIKASSGAYTLLPNLTQKELAILSLLVGNEKQAVAREWILEKLWGAEATEVYSDCINKHIETLRKKLGPLGKRIKTVYGSGYMFI